MKYNYQIARRVYQSTYEHLAEQFKIYVNSLTPNEIDSSKEIFVQTETVCYQLETLEVQRDFLVLLPCFTT